MSFLSAYSKIHGNSAHPGPGAEEEGISSARRMSLPIAKQRKDQYTPLPFLSSLTCLQTRDFSSRYCSIFAPSMAPRLLKWMSMYLPNRLELSLRIVFAFPKAVNKQHNMAEVRSVPRLRKESVSSRATKTRHKMEQGWLRGLVPGCRAFHL